EGRRIPPGPIDGVPNAGEALRDLGRRAADGVELVGPPGGQTRDSRAAGAPDDDRGVRPLNSLREQLAPLERVVAAPERERLLGEQAVNDLELLLEHLQALGAR